MAYQVFEAAYYCGITCGKCGVRFFVPANFDKEQQELGKRGGFYCPNGHIRVYVESTADALKRERDLLKQRVAQRDDEIRWQRDQREAAERSASARKGQITKLKKRALAGLCPCCNRSFTDLHRHMTTQHPQFTAEEVA